MSDILLNEKEYIFREEANGHLNFWHEDELSKYEAIDYATLAVTNGVSHLSEHSLTISDINEFFYQGHIKVVWRPDYKSKTGESTRITGEHAKLGLITVIVFNNLSATGEIRVINAWKSGPQDQEIWRECVQHLSNIESGNRE